MTRGRAVVLSIVTFLTVLCTVFLTTQFGVRLLGGSLSMYDMAGLLAVSAVSGVPVGGLVSIMVYLLLRKREMLRSEVARRTEELRAEIAQHKQTEKQLIEAEARFRAVLEHTPAVTCISKASSLREFVYVSPQIEQVLGFSQAEWLTSPDIWRKQIHREDRERVLAELAGWHSGTLRSEFRMLAKDSRVVWILYVGSAVRDNSDGPQFVQGVMLDITDRHRAEAELIEYRNKLEKLVAERTDDLQLANEMLQWEIGERRRAETALRESEQRYRLMIERTSDVVFASDTTGRFIYANPTSFEFTGYTEDELLTMHFSDLILPDWRARTALYYQQQAKNRVRETIQELPIATKDGQIKWVEQRVTLLTDADRVTGFQGIVRDVTRRKETEDDLRRRDVILEAVGFAAAQFLTATDLDNSIQQALSRLGQATGVSRVYMFENFAEPTGELRTMQRYQWCAPGVEVPVEKAATDTFSLDDPRLARWVATLVNGKPLYGHVRDFPEAERSLFALPNICSVVTVPIFVGEQWWGFLGFNQVDQEREWSTIEIEALSVAAGTLGAAIQRDRAEERIRFQAEVLEQVNEAVIAVDNEDRITFWNSGAERLYGLPAYEAIGKALIEVLRHRSGDTGQLSLQHRLEAVAWADNAIYFKRDGRKIYVEPSISEIKRADGTKIGALAVIRDISERKHAEDALRTTTLRLATLIESLQAGILVEDGTQHVALVNREFCDLFGLASNPHLLIGLDFSSAAERSKNLFTDPEGFVGRIQEILEARQIVTGEELTMQDGRRLERDYIPIILDSTYHGHLWQYRDVTERKQAEAALRESEEQLRRITDTMLDMIFQTDTDGNIQYASPSCWTILGCGPDRLLGKPIYDRAHPEDVERVKAAINDMSHATDRIEYRYLHADGHYIWIETISNLLFDDNWTLCGMICASRDITERKQIEQQLHELNRLKSDFLSTAAHELRTPLTSIRGFSEILLNRQLDEARQKRYLGLINEQSTHLGAIIDDLLDISRLEAGRHLKLTFDEVDVTALIDSVLVPFVETNAKHAIHVEHAPDLPIITGDKFRLAQVCKNLFSNAIKYSPKGGQVTVRTRLGEDHIEISVQDQGIGMTPEQQAHLFEKFYRANAGNTAISGTGLGLAISKLIVELHQGRIWAKSEYGVGTTFCFTLPLNSPGAEAVPAADSPVLTESAGDK